MHVRFLSRALAAILCLGLSGAIAFAQQAESESAADAEVRLEGKVKGVFSKRPDLDAKGRTPDISAFIKDPALAAKITEGGPRILSEAEYQELRENRLARRERKSFGAEKKVVDASPDMIDAVARAARRTAPAAEPEGDDSSSLLVLGVLGALAICGLAAARMRS